MHSQHHIPLPNAPSSSSSPHTHLVGLCLLPGLVELSVSLCCDGCQVSLVLNLGHPLQLLLLHDPLVVLDLRHLRHLLGLWGGGGGGVVTGEGVRGDSYPPITAFFLSVSASFSTTFCFWLAISSFVFSASLKHKTSEVRVQTLAASMAL